MSIAESQVIGRLLDQPGNIQNCDLKADEFTNESCRRIYSKILEFVENSQAISPFSIADSLEIETGKDWTVTCLRMSEESKGIGNFEADVNLVRRDGRINRIRQTLNKALVSLEYEKSPAVADKVIEDLMSINTSRKKTVHMIDEVVTSVLDRLERVNNSNEFLGVKTGLADLDKIIGGFHPTDLVVLAARPAVGKTALALNFANSAASDKPVLFFSCEQGHDQIGQRMFSVEGSVDSAKMRNVNFEEHEWAQVANAVHLLRKKKIIIADESYPSITYIIRTARQLKYEHDIQAIYVDYLQIVESTLSEREAKYQQVGQVARALKRLALELEIPVIVLAQVKRDVDARNDKRPLQGDISDSSEIEKTADVIMTLYRSDAYPDDAEKEESKSGTAEILICKNRHGPTGLVDCTFIGKFMQFKDLDHRYSQSSAYGSNS